MTHTHVVRSSANVIMAKPKKNFACELDTYVYVQHKHAYAFMKIEDQLTVLVFHNFLAVAESHRFPTPSIPMSIAAESIVSMHTGNVILHFSVLLMS